MSDKSLAIRGVVFNWLGRGCSIFITFFLTPFLVTKLGDESYGLWAIVMAFTSYYALADMGLRGAGVKYIAQFHAVDDHESVNKVFVTSLAVYSVVSAVILVLVGIAAYVFPFVIDIGNHAINNMRWVVLLTGATMATRMLAQVFGAALTALQRHDVSNGIAVAMQLLQAASVVFALLMGYNLVGMAVATFAVTVLGQILRAICSYRLLPELSFSPRYFDRETLKMVFRFGGMIIFANAARRLTTYSGGIIVGLFFGPAAVPFFTVPQALSQKTGRLGAAITNVMDPLTSRMDSKGDNDSLKEILVLGSRVMLAIMLSITVMWLFVGKPFLEFWIAPRYAAESYGMLCILSFAYVFSSTSGVMRSILRGMGQLRPITQAAMVEVVGTLSIGVVLTYFFGGTGMAVAILILQFVVGVILLPLAVCTAAGLRFSDYVVGAWFRGLAAAAPAALTAMLLGNIVHPQRMLHVLGESVCIAIVTCVGVFFTCLDNNHRAKIWASLTYGRFQPSK